MARIEWVKLRLENWALWKDRERGGGLGFATQAAFLRDMAVDRYRESVIPIDEVDASVTDQAVCALEKAMPTQHRVLWAIYVSGTGMVELSRLMGVPRSTLHANLDQADRFIANWFTARAAAQAQAKKSFTS